MFIEQSGFRLGVLARQTGQSVGGGQVVTLGWSQSSDPTWIQGNQIVIPNLPYGAGVYAISLRIAGPNVEAGGWGDVLLAVTDQVFATYIPEGKTQGFITAVQVLPVNAAIFVQVYNSRPDAQFFNADLTVLKVQS
jgi:hypothetical protein